MKYDQELGRLLRTMKKYLKIKRPLTKRKIYDIYPAI